MTGISIATVSRALSDPQKVKYTTRLRIEAAMRELQNQSRQEKSGIIGIIFPDISNQFFPLMLAGIDSISSSYDSTIMLCNSNGDVQSEEKSLRKLLDIKADGIIYIPAGDTPALLKEIIDNSIIPVVFLDRAPGLKSINLITTDNRNGMYQAARYLLTLGHRKILYLGPLAVTFPQCPGHVFSEYLHPFLQSLGNLGGNFVRIAGFSIDDQ